MVCQKGFDVHVINCNKKVFYKSNFFYFNTLPFTFIKTQGEITMTNALSAVPVYDEKLVKQFEPTIKFLIKQQVNNYNSSDICYETEDVYQDCLIHLWNATKIFKPNKGMKFKTFAIFHIKSRLGNFRNKVVNKNKRQTVSMSSLSSGWSVAGTEVNNQDSMSKSATINKQYSGFVNDLSRGNDALNEIIDAKKVFEKLTGNRKIIFSEYYIKGKKINQICEENEGFKYHAVSRNINYLDQIYKTLIKGEELCR